MKRATFAEGVGIALISSIAVVVLFTVLSSLLFSGDLFRLLIAGLAFFYINYLFLRSSERIGRFSIVLIWFVITLFSLVFIPSLFIYIGIQLVFIWLLRSLYFYNSILSALTDFALMALSSIVAIWVWLNSGSLFLTFWCFFLIQALFVFIPKNFISKDKNKFSHTLSDDRFEHAYHAAEVAVSKLINSK